MARGHAGPSNRCPPTPNPPAGLSEPRGARAGLVRGCTVSRPAHGAPGLAKQIETMERALHDAQVAGRPTGLISEKLSALYAEQARTGGAGGVTPERFRAALAALPSSHVGRGGAEFNSEEWLEAWCAGSAAWLSGMSGTPPDRYLPELRAVIDVLGAARDRLRLAHQARHERRGPFEN